MMPRVFLTGPIAVGQTVTVDGEDGHHFARVLRVRIGEQIAVAAQGQGFLAEVSEVDGKQGWVYAHVVGKLPMHESTQPVYLIQGLAKGDKIDAIIQHNTELGVAGFLLLETRRSIAKVDAKKLDSKVSRWQKIAREAASQAQRDIVPSVAYANSVDAVQAWLAKLENPVVLFLDEDESETGLFMTLEGNADEKQTMVLAIGPEGGWAPEERLTWLQQLSAQPVSLGPRTLRTETAGLVAASAVLHYYRQLGG